ncbi:hypothetical protein ZWY2020_031096 [Hordeum vulgare]|nr:hypothetical protein ZWY2020_031096 [Hordeum vulgare]
MAAPVPASVAAVVRGGGEAEGRGGGSATVRTHHEGGESEAQAKGAAGDTAQMHAGDEVWRRHATVHAAGRRSAAEGEAGGTRGRAFGRRECEARRRDVAVGLFVFPVQSRVTGANQWMALGQQNGCHIMLDTGALGPKDMDSLGLSLFQPDFIITSFYWVFGSDPTGFGCLLIKKSVTGSLHGRMVVMPLGWSGLFQSFHST